MFDFLKKIKNLTASKPGVAKIRYRCETCGSESEDETETCCDESRPKVCSCGSGKYAKECCES